MSPPFAGEGSLCNMKGRVIAQTRVRGSRREEKEARASERAASPRTRDREVNVRSTSVRRSPLISATPADKQLTPTANFTKDLGLDSLDTVEVVMAVEEEFAIEIPDQEADAINAVNDGE